MSKANGDVKSTENPHCNVTILPATPYRWHRIPVARPPAIRACVRSRGERRLKRRNLLAVESNFEPSNELTVHDAERGRDIPLRIYLPESTQLKAVVVLFVWAVRRSGQTGKMNSLITSGRRKGYKAVFVQHPGSDTSVWKDKLAENRMSDVKGRRWRN